MLQWIRTSIAAGRYHFTEHALTKHPLKEGFQARDALTAIERGTIIEQREEESRCLICGDAPRIASSPLYIANYIHCSVQWDYTDGVVNITMYRPKVGEWINQFTRGSSTPRKGSDHGD